MKNCGRCGATEATVSREHVYGRGQLYRCDDCMLVEIQSASLWEHKDYTRLNPDPVSIAESELSNVGAPPVDDTCDCANKSCTWTGSFHCMKVS